MQNAQTTHSGVPSALALRVVWLALVVGCGGAARAKGAAQPPDAGSSARTVKQRTVSIDLLRTAERVFDTDAAGALRYGKLLPLGGVAVCIAKRRSAFASSEPFEDLAPRLCVQSVAGTPLHFDGVPASSDLLVTFEKAGYRPATTTFRTDEYDVALADWVGKAGDSTYYIPLLSDGATLPLDHEVDAGDATGLVAIWVYATGRYSVGISAPVFNVSADPGVGQAEGVNVKITRPDGTGVVELQTRRDRPLFVSLPEASYRFEFTHPILELVPLGIQEQTMFAGLPTAAFNTIEVPVLRGRITLAAFDGYCPLPANPAQPFVDLATCAVGAIPDAGMP